MSGERNNRHPARPVNQARERAMEKFLSETLKKDGIVANVRVHIWGR